MLLRYKIDDIAYIIYKNKIRPVKIVGINVNKFNTSYMIEIENEDYESVITINLFEDDVYSHPMDITFALRNEYEQWQKKQEKLK